MEKNKELIEKAKMFENNINFFNKQIKEIEEQMCSSCMNNILSMLEGMEGKTIDLRHTNECTYILDELSYIDKVYVEGEIYVEYRLFEEVENGDIAETYEELLSDIEPRGVRDIFYTIVQELKRKYEWS